ncbi:NAD(P)/FAD-dependent oxidoreductase [Streptomyces sp. HMX112]|uniref:NAD(P)/FAD-dependent oxidoreductase n=1 Tax=Streptomyces sp. HMX112 TaxID=3390850 RepID=UPI003A8046D1
MSDSQNPNNVPTHTLYDAVIVGAGAAGLNTALLLGRSRRKVAVVDTGQPRNAPATHMQGFLTREGMSPHALLETGRAEVTAYGVHLLDAQADTITPNATGYTVHLAGGATLHTRHAVIATGLRDELPDIPGVQERWAKDLLHCPYCHGYEVRDQPLGVLGTHPNAVNQALLLRQWSDDIVLFPHTLTLTDDDHERLAARDITIAEGHIKRLEIDNDQLRGVELTEGRTVPRGAVFLFPRMVPRDQLLTDLGCHKNDAGWVTTDTAGRTSVPGIWAVGNVTDPRAQVITAAGMGSAAGFALNHDLVDDDVTQAVTQRRKTTP